MKQVRFSPQREVIYNYMLNTKAHPSAETIYNDLKVEHPDLSFATVYRNLKLLEELGKVKRVYVGDNVERYDACCNDHAHFVCICCKKVIDITGEKEMMVNKFKELNDAYSIARVCLTLEGLCPDCKEKGD